MKPLLPVKRVMMCRYKRLGCGGCPMLAIPYMEQLARKQKRIEACFPNAMPIIGANMPYHYRNKIISTFTPSRTGLISGLYTQGTHHVLPIENCLLENTRAGEVIHTVRNILCRHGIKAYHEDLRKGVLRHLLVRRGQTTGDILVTIVTATPKLPYADAIAKEIAGECPDVVTVVQNVNPRQTSAVLGFTERVLYGPGFIEDVLCGCRFRLSSRSFYQINSSQTEILYRLVVDMAGFSGNEYAVDAYCGIGTIGIIAAKKARFVTGIELNAAAVRDAIVNASQNGVANISFIRGDAGLAIRKMIKPPDVLFIDPPRTGCDNIFLTAICQSRPSRIVYVSCDIETLFRDTEILQANGYTLGDVRGIDMFPHTDHVETVVLMSRVDK